MQSNVRGCSDVAGQAAPTPPSADSINNSGSSSNSSLSARFPFISAPHLGQLLAAMEELHLLDGHLHSPVDVIAEVYLPERPPPEQSPPRPPASLRGRHDAWDRYESKRSAFR